MPGEEVRQLALKVVRVAVILAREIPGDGGAAVADVLGDRRDA